MNPSLNLKPKYLEQVRDILRSVCPAAEVLAYGSRVNGDCHEGSDLDLVIRQPDGAEFDAISELKKRFSESNIPILVDVLDWHATPPSFRDEIERKHVRIVLS